VIVEIFQSFHVELLIAQGVQESQVSEASLVPASYASLPRVPGLTARTDEGKILLCGGVLPQEPGIGKLWSLVSKDAGPYFLWLTRATKRYLGTQSLRRIEATTQFPQGCRWLQMLGFRYEGEVPGYGPNGETHKRFGRVV
jgi:hypothetical protein